MKTSNLIIGKSDWIPLNQVPSASSQKATDFWAQYPSTYGVYQVVEAKHAEEIGDDLVNPHIGYIGKSTNLRSRVYDIRLGGNHGCGKYIKQQGWDKKNILVRVLFVQEGDETKLEDSLFAEMKSAFDYRFKWTAASSGNDGNVVKILDILPKLDKDEATEVLMAVREHLGELLITEQLEQYGI